MVYLLTSTWLFAKLDIEGKFLDNTTQRERQREKCMTEQIKGQCEECGHDFSLNVDTSKSVEVHCEKCGNQTDNWDTVNGSMLAPFIVKIIK